jgi:ankyrin repeat protein
MDAKFHPAMRAIGAGDLDALKAIIREDPSLATARSSRSHPTLLQCLVLDGKDLPNKIEMGQVLINKGAEISGALNACASIDNVESAEALLDAGADINGANGWSPLEEALYWGNQRTIDMLLIRGASVHNLRIASGLGRLDLIEGFFNPDGSLRPEAGKIDWPFGELSWLVQPSETHPDLDIVNNAFIYACAHNRIDAAKVLLEKGAELDAIPPGFDYAGTALHNAALHGRREMIEFLLERGADPTIKDVKVHNTPAGWAQYAGHKELSEYLERRSKTDDIRP